jgi:DUF1680 family protein
MIKKLLRLFKSKKVKEYYYSDFIFKFSNDVIVNKRLQKVHDEKTETAIKNEASRLFEKYKNSKTININGKKQKRFIPFVELSFKQYMIYDVDTAKYIGADFESLIIHELKKLIEENDRTD